MQEEAQTSKELYVDIITPEQQIFGSSAFTVIVPGIQGKFGVLPGHISFMSLIEQGMVEVFLNENSTSTKFYVESGYAEVNQDKISILVGYSIALGENPVLGINNIIADLKTKKKSTTNPSEIKEADERINNVQKVIDYLNI